MNNDQHAYSNQNDISGKNELPDHEGNSIETEQSSDRINSLIQPLHDQYPNEDFGTIGRKT